MTEPTTIVLGPGESIRREGDDLIIGSLTIRLGANDLEAWANAEGIANKAKWIATDLAHRLDAREDAAMIARATNPFPRS